MDPEEVLGAAAHPSAELGPISPELALVDPVLAERARMLLPEPTEWTGRRRVVPVASPVSDRAEATGGPADPPRRRRWRKTLVLAGLVFAAGAASGGFLGRKQAVAPRGPFEAQDNVRTATRATDTRATDTWATDTRATDTRATDTRATDTRATDTRATDTRPQSLSKPKSTRRVLAQPRRAAQSAPNVLGVTTAVSTRGVRLGWQRPADSDHVAVIRTRGARRSNVIVFRGRGTSYRDVSAHSCTTYRYTIVNYDVRGHRSTGVPTSVVTQGCT
jgi:hypothetical protein